MRTRHPFPDVALEFDDGSLGSMEGEVSAELVAQVAVPHPDATEKGVELALGFMPHRGENRTTRRAAVANFKAEGANRRELLKQRQRQRRGTLDPELRRLQRKATKQ